MFAKSILVALLLLSTQAHAQDRHQPVSAHAAHEALTRGAVVLDVRDTANFDQERLPGAVSVPNATNLNRIALAQALSQAGVDLSREVLLVGEPGSPAVQALHQRLSGVASGRVLWLVGGLPEWQAVGAPTTQGSQGPQTARFAVPQHLVPLPQTTDQSTTHQTMAVPQRRATLTDLRATALYSYARLY